MNAVQSIPVRPGRGPLPGLPKHAVDAYLDFLADARLRAVAKVPEMAAEQRSFPDGHFNLIVAHILLHELPVGIIAAVIAEVHLQAPPAFLARQRDERTAFLDRTDGSLHAGLAENGREGFVASLKKSRVE